MGCQALIEEPPLIVGERERVPIRILGDGIPEILDQFEALGHGELGIVKRRRFGHDSIVGRSAYRRKMDRLRSNDKRFSGGAAAAA